MSAELHCHRCGYDLRAHPEDGTCPECGESVAESQRMAAIPIRPAWRDSDPRWRRRMLAGVWVLVSLPLMDAVPKFWPSRVPVPTLFDYRGTVQTVDDTFLFEPTVYHTLVFCMGTVLLFGNERGKRQKRFDWTRRWGVMCSYIVFLLCSSQILILGALVLAGIAAVFLSMPLRYQPEITELLVDLSTSYLRYGPYPRDIAGVVLAAFSSITVLLACFPLFDALRSSGSKRNAAIVLSPLALFALLHIVDLVQYCFGSLNMGGFRLALLSVYFRPELLLGFIGGSWLSLFGAGPTRSEFFIEAAKWFSILAIAIWLTVAQVAAWRNPTRKSKDAR